MADIDDKIIELLNIVTKRKQEVEDLEKETKQSWKTNCSFPPVFGGTTPINIQVQTELAIIQLQADLLVQQEYLKKASGILGATFNDKWGNFSFEDWTTDFKKRIAIINVKEKRKKLDELEERLNAIVSPEQRRALELSEITKSLGI
jgi:hypothetical protein